MLETNKMNLRTTTDQEMTNAVKDFVNALVNAPQYQQFDRASAIFQGDKAAVNALHEYQAKAKDLQTKQMFNMVPNEEKDELERLWMKFLSFQSVKDYFHAQEVLQALCQECAQVISEDCGLDYATACGASCCG
jgi:cell fate (sporulation/competence/biofilm development) regulator YlbF (YheA/YmcA/DUF963 family)